MKKGLLSILAAIPLMLNAQKESDKNTEMERIIITKKSGEGEKMNIVVDGEQITVNGKPINEAENGGITVKRLKIKDPQTFNWSPETGFDNDNRNIISQERIMRMPNKAMLGVITEKTEEGVQVKSVNDETGAQKAGLKEGDIITKIDDKIIESPDQLSESLKNKNPGDKVSITYKRKGSQNTVTAELTKWNAPQIMTFDRNNTINFSAPNIDFEELMSRMPGNMDDNRQNGNIRFYGGSPFSSGPKLGAKVQDIEQGSGVKIIELEKDANASNAGLLEGDIIKEANGKEIKNINDLMTEIEKSRTGATLKLKINRSGKLQNIEVPFKKKIKTANL